MKAKCLLDMRKDLCLDPMYLPNKTGAVGACHPIAYIVVVVLGQEVLWALLVW